MAGGDFWNNSERAQQTVATLKNLRAVVTPLKSALEAAADLEGLLAMVEEDPSTYDEVAGELTRLEH